MARARGVAAYELRCPVYLVVFAFDQKVAAGAAQPIETFQPGTCAALDEVFVSIGG